MWRVFLSPSTINVGIVGFYSLSSFTFAIADLSPEYAKRLPRYDLIPAALIGRVARDERVRREGVGDLLLTDAVRRSIGALRSLAAFAIGASNEEAAAAILDSIHSRAARLCCHTHVGAAEAATRILSYQPFYVRICQYLTLWVYKRVCSSYFTTG